MENINYSKLDDGIRDQVKLLRDAGFDTCDSGDGSKYPEYPEALGFPHIVFTSNQGLMVGEAERAAHILGGKWIAEATYSTGDKLCSVLCILYEPSLGSEL